MALAPMHRQARKDSTENYAIGDVRLAVPEGAGIDGVAGSVTSFVRKLFQMVQGECDDVVGFVPDGTAFEVKDPRRLEQDILPKYFRHSRFQSLVRQLNFYSFKKISKERSVWIYKHAYFRRDEPELLHALKRKTNQHGARIGVEPDVDEDLVEHRSSREVPPRRQPPPPPPPLPHHHHHHHHHHLTPLSSTGVNNNNGRGILPERPAVAGNKLQSNSRSGGGPSMGGVGGAAAPCYGRGPSSRMPGFAWPGAGGRPVVTSHDYHERIHDAHSGVGNSSVLSQHDTRKDYYPPASHEYRQGTAMSDVSEDDANSYSNRRGVKRGPASTAAPDSTPAAADREHALALWGLSALCQAASSSAAAVREQGEEGSNPPSHPSSYPSQPPSHQDSDRWEGSSHDDSNFSDRSVSRPSRVARNDENRPSNPLKRPCRGSINSTRPRGSWGYGDGRRGAQDGSSEEDEDDEEGGTTSTDREDSPSSFHSRSGISSSGSNIGPSPEDSPSHEAMERTSTNPATATVSDHNYRRQHHDNYYMADERMGQVYSESAGDATANSRGHGHHEKNGSRLFRPPWGWARAADRTSDGLPGTFVDRRATEGIGKDDTDGTVFRSEEEDEEEDEEADQEDTEEGEERESTPDHQDMQDEEALSRTRDPENGHETDGGDAEENGPQQHGDGEEPAYPGEGSTDEGRGRGLRDMEADRKAEVAVGLAGIGEILKHSCNTKAVAASSSIYLAAVSNSGDDGLREIAVFCSGPAGLEPDAASPAILARHISAFLQDEDVVAQDLGVYAQALDPSAVDVIKRATSHPTPAQSAKLLRIFCRYAASRLGRALEVVSAAAEDLPPDLPVASRRPMGSGAPSHQLAAQRMSPQLDECRWRWWRAAVRFS